MRMDGRPGWRRNIPLLSNQDVGGGYGVTQAFRPAIRLSALQF